MPAANFIAGGSLPPNTMSFLFGGAVSAAVLKVYQDYVKARGLSLDPQKPEDQEKIKEAIACEKKSGRYFGPLCSGCGGCIGAGRLGMCPRKRPKCGYWSHSCKCLFGGRIVEEDTENVDTGLAGGDTGDYGIGGGDRKSKSKRKRASWGNSEWDPTFKAKPGSRTPAHYGVPASDYAMGSMVAGRKGMWRAYNDGQNSMWVPAHKWGKIVHGVAYAGIPKSLRPYCVPNLWKWKSGQLCGFAEPGCGCSSCGGTWASKLKKAQNAKNMYQLIVDNNAAIGAFKGAVSDERYDAAKASFDAMIAEAKRLNAMFKDAAKTNPDASVTGLVDAPANKTVQRLVDEIVKQLAAKTPKMPKTDNTAFSGLFITGFQKAP